MWVFHFLSPRENVVDCDLVWFGTYYFVCSGQWRLTVMTRKACAANMGFKVTQPSNGFQKALWSQKSECPCHIFCWKVYYFIFHLRWSSESLIVNMSLFFRSYKTNIVLCIWRYEGPRTAEALIEFVNNEGGAYLLIIHLISKVVFRRWYLNNFKTSDCPISYLGK